jgi:hypothetical protein
VNLIGCTLRLAAKVSTSIGVGLFDITGNIKGVAGGFGDGKTVVESNAAWDGTESAIRVLERENQ